MLNENTKNKIRAYIILGLFLGVECYFSSYENLKDSAICGALILNIA